MSLVALFYYIATPNLALAQSNLVEEVRCINGSCLQYGYEKYDAQGVLFEVGECAGSNCDVFGWTIYRVSGLNTAVVCEGGSCFSSGFSEINTVDNTLFRIRSCVEGSCLENGWNDHIFQPAESLEKVSCDANGCDSGFILEQLAEEIAGNEEEIAKLQKKIDQTQRVINRLSPKAHSERLGLIKVLARLRARIVELEEKIAALQSQVVVKSQQAICLAPNACFTVGYQIFE